jgi:hypothetical protein
MQVGGTSALDGEGFLAWGRLSSGSAKPLVLGSVHAPVGKASTEDLDGRAPDSVTRRSHLATGPYRTDAAFAVVRDVVAGSPFLVAGDWNVSRLWDDRRRITECHEFFDRAASAGWSECSFSDPELRTWHKGSQAPYQLDHAFSDPETAQRVSSVSVDPWPASTASVSDHAPLIIDIEP